jgi:hypothetical protein
MVGRQIAANEMNLMDNALFGLEYAFIFFAIPIALIVIGTLFFAAIAERMHLSASTLWAFLAVLAISILAR